MSKKKAHFEKLGVMIDCSRNSVMTVNALKRLTDILSGAGYNTLQLYTEDTYEVDGEPYFGYLRGRYSKAELKEIDAYALGKGIELIPCIQTLAHLNQIFRWPAYKEINDCNDILFAGEERTYSLIDNMFSTVAECFTSRRVNIGMDEAHMIGLGKYLDKHGYKNRWEIMLAHLERVSEIAGRHGFSCMMWSDMFFRMASGGEYYALDAKIPDEVIKRIPGNVSVIYWDYYHLDKGVYDAMNSLHKSFANPAVFAGGAWTWRGLVPHNKFSIDATRAAFASCIGHGVKEVFLCMWGDNGGSCSPFSVLPALVTAAELAAGNDGDAAIREKFARLTGMPFDMFMRADLPDILNTPSEQTANPSKYLFYNDSLLGIFDSTIACGDGDIYSEHAAKLKEAEKYREWAFLFKPLRLLCEALYYKADLGIRTRAAYGKKDKAALRRLLDERYKPLIKKTAGFYNAFAAYWDTLFKPHGFDIIDHRLGGAIQRLKHIVKKLEKYTGGAADSIPELDERLLDYAGGGEAFQRKAVVNNHFNSIFTVNRESDNH